MEENVEQIKEKLLHFEHLAIMGKVILCATCELNNLLEEVKDFLTLVQDNKNDLAAGERNLTKALKNLDKMSLTIKSLLSFPNKNLTI